MIDESLIVLRSRTGSDGLGLLTRCAYE